jgi:DNA-binding GntR family transcriptional regulator
MSRSSDAAYALIKAKILSGELAANTQLTERELAEICGTSRTPIRDALRRLEAETLIRRTGTARCFIQDWNADKVEEIYSLRALVESHAALRAASRITDQQIDELRHWNQAIGRASAAPGEPDPAIFAAANRAFHGVVLAAAGSERLMAMRGLLFEPAIAPLQERRIDRARLGRSLSDHEELIDALSRRDAEGARALMEAHIRHAFYMDARRPPAVEPSP